MRNSTEQVGWKLTKALAIAESLFLVVSLPQSQLLEDIEGMCEQTQGICRVESTEEVSDFGLLEGALEVEDVGSHVAGEMGID